MGLFNLAEHPFTDIGERAIAITREFLQDSAQFAHTLRTFFSDEPAFNDLHLSSMRHRHNITLLDNYGGHSGAGRYANLAATGGNVCCQSRPEMKCVHPAAYTRREGK